MNNGKDIEDNNEEGGGKKETLLEMIITDHLGCFVFTKVLFIIYSFAFRWDAIAAFKVQSFSLVLVN